MSTVRQYFPEARLCLRIFVSFRLILEVCNSFKTDGEVIDALGLIQPRRKTSPSNTRTRVS